uniref:Uncharacterized protein n=1 Tax=Arundo donax TaxID=35708 RepID=A0A0A9GUD3_ARUDO
MEVATALRANPSGKMGPTA